MNCSARRGLEDQLLLLCSDGVWEMMEPEEALEIVDLGAERAQEASEKLCQAVAFAQQTLEFGRSRARQTPPTPAKPPRSPCVESVLRSNQTPKRMQASFLNVKSCQSQVLCINATAFLLWSVRSS